MVRSFGVIGRVNPQGANGGQLVSTLRLPREWKRENLRAVVFVQERDTFRITGASVVDLHRIAACTAEPSAAQIESKLCPLS